MYVEVTLYKSGFTPEDVFIGTSSENRLQSLEALPQLTLPRAPFNPSNPFRLHGNFLTFDRQYDYTKYEYFKQENDTEPVSTRWFFIRNFLYVNDDVSEMIVAEDLIGELYHQLQFTRFLPDRLTYKKSVVGSNFEKEDFGNTFIANRLKSFRKKLTNSDLYIGLIVATVLSSNAYYYENGQNMPCENILFPFLYNENGIEFLKKGVCSNFPIYPNNNIIIRDISDFRAIFNISQNNFSFISSFIMLETSSFISEASLTTGIIGVDYKFEINNAYIENSNLERNYYGQTPSAGAYLVTHQLKQPFIDYFTIPTTKERFTQVAPYTTYSISFNGSKIDIDSAWFNKFLNNSEEEELKIYFGFSFLPPYNYYIFVNDDVQTKSVQKIVATFSNDSNIMDYTDKYTEWLKSNYNSTVTGLKIQQDAQKESFGLSALKNIVMGGAIGGALRGGSTGAIAGTITGAVNSLFDYQNLKINQATERKMLDLKIQDLQSAPDYASFNGSISAFIFCKNDLFIDKNENVFNEFIEAYYQAYGVRSDIPATLPSHERFDYIRGDDYILSTDSPKLPLQTQSQLREYFRAGVRLWYTLEDFKNVTYNEEV